MPTRVCVIGTDVADALYPHRGSHRAGAHGEGPGLYAWSGSSRRRARASSAGATTTSWRFPSPPSTSSFRRSRTTTSTPSTSPPCRSAPEDYQALIDEETGILRARRGLRPNQPNDFAIFTSEGQLRTFQQTTGAVAGAMLLIAGIALLVGGVGVMNIMLVNVTQRTREIGVRKALGATRRDIATQFLMEAVTLTGFGGAIGDRLRPRGGPAGPGRLRVPGGRAALVGAPRLRRIDGGGRRLRNVAGHEGRPAGSYRGPPVRVATRYNHRP